MMSCVLVVMSVIDYLLSGAGGNRIPSGAFLSLLCSCMVGLGGSIFCVVSGTVVTLSAAGVFCVSSMGSAPEELLTL